MRSSSTVKHSPIPTYIPTTNIPLDDLRNIEYDEFGRMNYHPDIHFNHKRPWTEEDLAYLCRFHHSDGCDSLQYALGRTSKTLGSKVCDLRKEDMFDYYYKLYTELDG
jgi:hypothetical protein